MTDLSTREIIVRCADELFYETGFEATSFADIAGAVGISRGNFYHHFKAKDDILAAVIAVRRERTRAMLIAWESEGETPQARLLSFARLLVTNRAKIMAHGCPVGTLCSELAKLDHAAKEEAAGILGLFRDWLEGQFRALGKGEASTELALRLLGWSQGTAVLASAFRGEGFIRAEVDRIETWLATLHHTPAP